MKPQSHFLHELTFSSSLVRARVGNEMLRRCRINTSYMVLWIHERAKESSGDLPPFAHYLGPIRLSPDREGSNAQVGIA